MDSPLLGRMNSLARLLGIRLQEVRELFTACDFLKKHGKSFVFNKISMDQWIDGNPMFGDYVKVFYFPPNQTVYFGIGELSKLKNKHNSEIK